jgi:hypothetical protein
MIPAVHVTYQQDVYHHHQLTALTQRAEQLPPAGMATIIDWQQIIPPLSVVCYPWIRGFHVDLPFRRTRMAPLLRE